MALFTRRKRTPPQPKIPFDPLTQLPVVKSSVCTGEKVAGFKDIRSGRFTDVALIRSEADLAVFKTAYGIDEVKTEY